MTDYQIIQGDCLQTLKTLPDGIVQTCVTSPPYYGLRCYNGGDAEIGLEESPDLYVAKLVEVFREVRRVLHPTGVLWLNLGDSYASSPAGNKTWGDGVGSNKHYQESQIHQRARKDFGLGPKQLLGIPWRVAFALQADGWILRSAITWCKTNPMPESVTDRCTSATEMVFMLAKSQTYFYDAEAIKEPASQSTITRSQQGNGFAVNAHNSKIRQADNSMAMGGTKVREGRDFKADVENGRNRRNWWVINSEPYPGSHFATMPTKLVEPCILAGSKPGDTVLDCFSGAATTGLVALKHGRKYLGLELNESYIEMSHKRLLGVASQQRLFEVMA